MTDSVYGERRPVYSGTRRVPGLYERDLTGGRVVFDAALRLDRKVRRLRLDARTKTDAIAEVEALRVDTRRGEQQRSPALAPTLAELAADYVAALAVRVGDRDPKRRRSPRTVADARYKLDLHVLPLLGSITAAELTRADVLRLLDALTRRKLSPNTRTGVLNTLSGLLRYGMKLGVLERNVVRDVDRDDRPGVTRASEPRYLTRDELDRLLAGMGDTFRPVAAVCTFAALRVSEALGLRWADVDFNAVTLTVRAQLAPDGTLAPVKTAASAAPVPMLPAGRLRAAVTRCGRCTRPVDTAGLNGGGRERVELHDLRHSYGRARARRRRVARRDGRGRRPRERARHGAGVRGARRRRPREGIGEDARRRVRRVGARAWQHSALVRVRSALARLAGFRSTVRFDRTGANGRERRSVLTCRVGGWSPSPPIVAVEVIAETGNAQPTVARRDAQRALLPTVHERPP